MQPPTDQHSARRVALATSALAAAALLYMGSLAAIDAMAGKALASAPAQAFAARVCARTAGCEHLRLAPGFDWQHLQRKVFYRMQVGLRTRLERQEALNEIRTAATAESYSLLGWALRAEPVLEASLAPANERSAQARANRGRER